MKNKIKFISKIFSILLVIFVVACGKNNNTAIPEVAIDYKVKGGIPDKIIYSIEKDKTQALKNILNGQNDIFIDKIPFSILNKLDKNTKEKLEIYSIPSSSWAFLLNPVPNKAPYQVEVNGIKEFNPFAIKELRYALNYLMSRKYISDEVLKGSGEPSFSPISPINQNAWRFDLQAKRLGLTTQGDKIKAIKDINSALEKASNLPENRGNLIKKNGFWYFQNKLITLKFVINTEDSEEKLKLNNYFTGLIEESGIKVEKLSWNNSKSIESIYNDDPSKLGWHIYTEELNSDSGDTWQDMQMSKQLTSVLGNQPGWGEINWWNYKNEEADRLGNKLLNDKIESIDGHLGTLLKLNEIALNEAIRIFAVNKTDYYVANKENFKERVFYSLSNGIDRNSLESLNIKGKSIKVSQYSGATKPFETNWNPFEKNLLRDSISTNILQMLYDGEITKGPFGQLNEKRVSVVSSKIKPIFEKDLNGEITKVNGDIPVDENALKFNLEEKIYKKVGLGIKSAIETTYRINYGMWHSGRKIKKSDYIYTEKFVNDMFYSGEKKLNSIFYSNFENLVGTKWNSDGTVTIWSNKFSPKGGLYNVGVVPSLKININSNSDYTIPWEILEAIKFIISEGSKSGIKYDFVKKEGAQEIDLKSTTFIADLRAKLVEFTVKKHIPESIKTEVTLDEALTNYNLVIKFIDNYGHALIGNGPYMLSKLDLKTGIVELSAFREKEYTEERGKWAKIYRVQKLKIESIKIPKQVKTGEELSIKVDVSETIYPSDQTIKTINGSIYGLFINKDGEIRVDAVNNSDGTFSLSLDPETAKSFKGAYTLVIIGTLDGKFTDTKTTEIVFK